MAMVPTTETNITRLRLEDTDKQYITQSTSLSASLQSTTWLDLLRSDNVDKRTEKARNARQSLACCSPGIAVNTNMSGIADFNFGIYSIPV